MNNLKCSKVENTAGNYQLKTIKCKTNNKYCPLPTPQIKAQETSEPFIGKLSFKHKLPFSPAFSSVAAGEKGVEYLYNSTTQLTTERWCCSPGPACRVWKLRVPCPLPLACLLSPRSSALWYWPLPPPFHLYPKLCFEGQLSPVLLWSSKHMCWGPARLLSG